MGLASGAGLGQGTLHAWFNWLSSARACCLALLLTLGVALSVLIPPLQSPDETAHAVRAYLLSRGHVLLKPPPHPSVGSGGYVDDGLIAYARIFLRVVGGPDSTVTRRDILASETLRWKGTRSFVPAEGTGYYLPIAYLPQAIGFRIGKKLDLSIDYSYRLARFLTFAASVAALAAAFRIYPTNPLVVALLILPMSVFQLLSLSLDGWTNALAILAISLFMRGALVRYEYRTWMMYVLAACVLVLACSRTHLMPLVALPLVLYFVRRDRAGLWCFLATAVLSLAWLVVSVKTTVPGPTRPNVAADIALHYASHPLELLRVLADTLQYWPAIKFYWTSFIGNLGALETPFPPKFYELTSWLLLGIILLSMSLDSIRVDWHARAALLVLSFTSCVLVFVALLITWTPHPASIIAGVQGRYFFVPALMLAYALAGAGNVSLRSRAVLSHPVVGIYGLVVAYSLTKLLVLRYYAQP
jgi:uncharacterized membrane protein